MVVEDDVLPVGGEIGILAYFAERPEKGTVAPVCGSYICDAKGPSMPGLLPAPAGKMGCVWPGAPSVSRREPSG